MPDFGDWVAVYAAILSTALGYVEWRKRRPRVKVTAEHGYTYVGGKASEPLITIEAVNVGGGSVHLNSVGFLQKGGKKLVIGSVVPPKVLPAELEERKRLTVLYACRWFRENLDHEEVIGAYFGDQTGRQWVGKVKRKQKEKWLSSKVEGWLLEDYW